MTSRLLGGGIVTILTIYILFYIMNDLAVLNVDLFSNSDLVIKTTMRGFNEFTSLISVASEKMSDLNSIVVNIKNFLFDNVLIKLKELVENVYVVIRDFYNLIIKYLAKDTSFWNSIKGWISRTIGYLAI